MIWKRNGRVKMTLSYFLLLGPTSMAYAAQIQLVDPQGQPIANAAVMVQGERASSPSEELVTVSQVQQQFFPRVTVINVGSVVRFPNKDNTLHHVYSFSEAKSFELELYAGDAVHDIVFDSPGIVSVGCNIHDWMLGFIVVTDAATFGVTDAQGQVTLEIDDSQSLTLMLWHPAIVGGEPQSVQLLAEQARVSVALNPTDPLEFEIDPLQDLFSQQAK